MLSIIFNTLIIILIIHCIYILLYRNHAVYKFNLEIIDKIYDCLINNLDISLEEGTDRYEVMKKVNIFKLLFYMKKLKIENYYTKEQIDFMFNKNSNYTKNVNN